MEVVYSSKKVPRLNLKFNSNIGLKSWTVFSCVYGLTTNFNHPQHEQITCNLSRNRK